MRSVRAYGNVYPGDETTGKRAFAICSVLVLRSSLTKIETEILTCILPTLCGKNNFFIELFLSEVGHVKHEKGHSRGG